MVMRRYAIILFTLVLMTLTFIRAEAAQDKQDPKVKYIEKYASLAVSEMYRSGVPASITLAQGLLESRYGLSELAVKGNNHFGIKCHNWKGPAVYHDDDRKGECFRKYDNVEQSFRDHSDFLRYRDRYSFLFDLKITDYKGWAYGLKKAGYATDPHYPSKLINLIEDYRLYEYDSGQMPDRESKKDQKKVSIPKPPSQIEKVMPLSYKQREEFSFALSREMFSQNGVPFVYAHDGETYASLASKYNLFLRELLKFNDLDKEVELLPGTVVYLQKKKSKSAKGLDKHVVSEGETLRDIAQRFAVRRSSLMRINGLSETSVIAEGDMLKLRK